MRQDLSISEEHPRCYTCWTRTCRFVRITTTTRWIAGLASGSHNCDEATPMSKPTADELNVNLTPPVLRPVAGSPWSDDALQREGIASELTKLAATLVRGEESATIALDGGYGTGKTFILQRWVQELQDHGRVAVYYNAWENDCDDDPLVSLIETLASDAKAKKWREATWGVLNAAVEGVVRKYMGVDVQKVRKVVADGQTVGLLDAAAGRRKSRETLKELLEKLVKATSDKEEVGVVIVIDELDRCRPTFATELMERVKHVLNVPGLVFVFGVNMVALRETVRARYGEIDAHQYLLRMFTATLLMPLGIAFHGRDGRVLYEGYVDKLIDRFGLRAFCEQRELLGFELPWSKQLLLLIASGGRVTPREIERVVWLLAKVASSSLPLNQAAYSVLPHVLVPLAVARVKAPDAYYQAVSIPDRATAMMDCLFELIHDAKLQYRQRWELDKMEMAMYRVCHEHPLEDPNSPPPAYVALEEYIDESSTVLDGRHLSRRLAHISKNEARALLDLAPEGHVDSSAGHVSVHLPLTFETLQSITALFDTVWPQPT